MRVIATQQATQQSDWITSIFSKGLHFVPDTLPLCSGPGLVSPTTAPDEYPTGDHCYIGAIAYLTQTEVENYS
jgi:hypothetical protein